MEPNWQQTAVRIGINPAGKKFYVRYPGETVIRGGNLLTNTCFILAPLLQPVDTPFPIPEVGWDFAPPARTLLQMLWDGLVEPPPVGAIPS